MTTPVLEALHRACPGARVDIVSDRRSEGVFQSCPYRGDIMYKEKARFLRGAPALICRLLNRRYDIIVALRTDGLAWLLRGRTRFTKRGARPYGPHAIERMMGVIRALHGEQPIPDTRLWLDEDSIRFARSVVPPSGGGRLLALGPGCGGSREEKFWPTEKYRLLALSLADIFDRVMLLGGPGDAALCRAIRTGLGHSCIDMCQRTSLQQAAALLQEADMFVGSDSGLGHVAAAVDTPTLTFFSVDDPQRCLPRGPATDWLMGENRDARNIPVEDAEDRIRRAINV